MSEPNAAETSAANDPEFEQFKAWKAAQDAASEAAKPKSYYVHLADGQVVTLDEAQVAEAGTHFDGIQIVNRYEVGA